MEPGADGLKPTHVMLCVKVRELKEKSETVQHPRMEAKNVHGLTGPKQHLRTGLR